MTEPRVRVDYIARRVGSDDIEECGGDPVKAHEAVKFWNTLPFTGASPYRLIKRTTTEEDITDA